MKCSDVMTKDPVCCVPEDPVQQVALIMKKRDVGSLPVVVDEMSRKLIGMITDRDIVVKVVADGRDCARERVVNIMSRDPVTCRPEDPLEVAIQRMGERKIRRLPVVDTQGCVVGIIAQADIATRSGEEEQTAELVREVSL